MWTGHTREGMKHSRTLCLHRPRRLSVRSAHCRVALTPLPEGPWLLPPMAAHPSSPPGQEMEHPRWLFFRTASLT